MRRAVRTILVFALAAWLALASAGVSVAWVPGFPGIPGIPGAKATPDAEAKPATCCPGGTCGCSSTQDPLTHCCCTSKPLSRPAPPRDDASDPGNSRLVLRSPECAGAIAWKFTLTHGWTLIDNDEGFVDPPISERAAVSPSLPIGGRSLSPEPPPPRPLAR
jgi:hypothetical protein